MFINTLHESSATKRHALGRTWCGLNLCCEFSHEMKSFFFSPNFENVYANLPPLSLQHHSLQNYQNLRVLASDVRFSRRNGLCRWDSDFFPTLVLHIFCIFLFSASQNCHRFMFSPHVLYTLRHTSCSKPILLPLFDISKSIHHSTPCWDQNYAQCG